MKKINEDFTKALIRSLETLSISDLSRRTGVRIDILNRHLTRQSRHIREETWNKIIPVLKPYLASVENENKCNAPLPRIGNAYRKHLELVDMVSDQKVLLDAFEIIADKQKEEIIKDWIDKAENYSASEFISLTEQENRLMGAYLGLPKEIRESELLKLVSLAINEIKIIRKES